MHARGEPSGHEHEVARLRQLLREPVTLDRPSSMRVDARPPTSVPSTPHRSMHRQARGVRLRGARINGARTYVDDGGDRRPAACRSSAASYAASHAVTSTTREPCDHAIPVEIGAGRPGQHDAGPVVARENQRALDGARCQHDFLGPHLPLALTRLAAVGPLQMIAQALIEPEQIVWEVAKGGGAGQQRDSGVDRERLQRACKPGVRNERRARTAATRPAPTAHRKG